jgi:hypothetical protein
VSGRWPHEGEQAIGAVSVRMLLPLGRTDVASPEQDRREAARMRYMAVIAMARLGWLARGRSTECLTSEPREAFMVCERHHDPPNRVVDEFENGNGDLAVTNRG